MAASRVLSSGWTRWTSPAPHGVAGVAVVALCAWLVVNELDRLERGIADRFDRSSGLGDVVSPSAWSERVAWETWSESQVDGLRALLLVHAAVGVVAALSAGLLLLWTVRDCAKARLFVALYGTAVLVETGLLLVTVSGLATDGSRVPRGLASVLAAVAVVKWGLVAVALLLAGTAPALRSRVRKSLTRGWHALYLQRLSVGVVGLVAVLALVPGPNVWDQVPDVYRGWVADCPDLSRGDCRGAVHGLVVLGVALLLAAGLLLLGRQRAELAVAATRAGYSPGEVRTAWWWAVPAGTVVVALLLGPWGAGVVGVDAPFWFFVGVPLALLGLPTSLRLLLRAAAALDRVTGGRCRRPAARLAVTLGISRADEEEWRGYPPERAVDVRLAGDVLALALPVVLLLGLVRAYTALAATGLVSGSDAAPRTGTSVTAATLLLVLALLLALALVLRGPALVSRLTARQDVRPGLRRAVGDLLDPEQTEVAQTPLTRVVGVLALALALVGLVVLVLAPRSVTSRVGVLGTVLLCLGLWVMFLGIVQVRLQRRRPLEVFRWFGLRAAPLMTLLLAVPTAAGALLSPDRDLHAVRLLEGPAPVQVPLREVIDAWVGANERCAVPSAVAGARVQPMLLVAASGGGIRAAYWTTHLMDRLQRHSTCANDATVLSSGVSGGAVGLALSRDGSGVRAVERMADPDVLGVASAGLLVGDLVAGTTGLRVPALLDGESGWLDRAGLMERRWEEIDPGLAARFDRLGSGPSGALVLNSAAAGVGCRVLVSQVELSATPSGVPRSLRASTDEEQAAAQCTRPTRLPAASVDLYDLYDRQGCSPPVLRLGTGAMLAARFPTVTPGGRMPVTGDGCQPRPDVQLVDGGYGEASAVGTIADLAPRIASLLRVHNARSDRVVVPLVVFLEEEPRIDLAPEPAGLVPEALVPLAGRRAAAAQTTSGTWLQRASAALEDVCPAERDGERCRQVVKAVREELPAGAVVVAPRTQPDVDAPLGWTLSGASRNRLQSAMQQQADEGCTPVRGYACLGRLLPRLHP